MLSLSQAGIAGRRNVGRCALGASAKDPHRVPLGRLWWIVSHRFGVLMAATVAATLAAAIAAEGQLYSYCGVRVNSGTWCGNNTVNHSYHAQIVNISTCPSNCITYERMLRDDNHAVRSPGPTYSIGSSTHGYCYTGAGLTTTQYEAEAAYSGSHNQGVPSGSAYYGTQSPNICQV